jgi:O-antigen/teichoic acid export membrane protein
MDESEILTKKVFRGSFIVLMFTFLGAPLGYLIRILYSQTLSIEMYGLFYAVISLFGILATYNDLGFGFSVSYFVPKYFKKKNYSSCWNLYVYDQIIELGSSIFISILLVIFGKWLALNYFRVPGAENLIYILSIYFIANSCVEALNRFFNGLQQEKFYSSIQFSRLSFVLIFSVLFWLFDMPNVLLYAASWALAYALVAIIYNFFLYKFNKNIINKFSWDKKLFRLMFNYAVPTLATTSIYTFINFTDTFFLTLFKGVEQVGIYNIVLPIVSVGSIFLSPINGLLFPLISHLKEGEEEKISKILNIILRIIPFIGIYFSLFIILFPSPLIKYLFGSKWLGLVENPLIILSIGIIASSLSGYMCTFVSALGKVKERLYISIFIAITNIILNLFFVYYFGVTGAVIANSFIYLLSVFLYGKVIKSVFLFKYPIFFYSKLFIFSLIIFFLTRFFHIEPNSLWQIIFGGIIYSIIIILFGFYLNIFNKKILKLFQEIYHR